VKVVKEDLPVTGGSKSYLSSGSRPADAGAERSAETKDSAGSVLRSALPTPHWLLSTSPYAPVCFPFDAGNPAPTAGLAGGGIGGPPEALAGGMRASSRLPQHRHHRSHPTA